MDEISKFLDESAGAFAHLRIVLKRCGEPEMDLLEATLFLASATAAVAAIAWIAVALWR